MTQGDYKAKIEALIVKVLEHGRECERNDSAYRHAPETFVMEFEQLIRDARKDAIEQARTIINQYSIHTPKGQPKGTVARRHLNNKLYRLESETGTK